PFGFTQLAANTRNIQWLWPGIADDNLSTAPTQLTFSQRHPLAGQFDRYITQLDHAVGAHTKLTQGLLQHGCLHITIEIFDTHTPKPPETGALQTILGTLEAQPQGSFTQQKAQAMQIPANDHGARRHRI